MAYKLKGSLMDGKDVRIYTNEKTGSEVVLDKIYTDESTTTWWGFRDMFQMPMMRQIMAKNIINLFSAGLALADIQKWCTDGKAMCRSNDPEKYEKLYAQFMQMQLLAESTADPRKQYLGLATVYVLKDGERVDWYSEEEAGQKLSLWAAHPEMAAFFLNWQDSIIKSYMKTYSDISETASKITRERQQLRQQG